MLPLLLFLAVFALSRAQHQNFECAFEDDAHSSLIGAGKSGGFRTCTYSEAGQCAYSADGYFSSGDSTCPNTLSVATNQSDMHAASMTICPPTDNDGTGLTGSGVSGKFKTCTYVNAGLCTYLSDGLFSSGGSVCPDTIVPGSCVRTSAAQGTSSAGSSPQGDTVLPASNLDSSGASDERGSAGGLSPALIALLVLNVVLVVIIIILGAMLSRARRAAGPSRLKGLYTGITGGEKFGSLGRSPRYYSDGIDTDFATVPLTHGGSSYSDPHE